MSEVELFRINSLISDIGVLRLECDWVNDQTDQSFRGILEKGDTNFLFIELLWSIGKELSPYYDIKFPLDKNDGNAIKKSFTQLLNSIGYSGNGNTAQLFEGENSQLVSSRISMFEYVFFQLQSIQLDLFNQEYNHDYDQQQKEETENKMKTSSDSDLDDQEMRDHQQEQQNDLINKIQILSDLLQIRFNNLDNFITVLNIITHKIESVLNTLPKDFISQPFFKNTQFTDDEKTKIEEMSLMLFNDYSKRSEVLCKRLDVTIESLLWSERVQSKLDEINWHIRYQREIFPSIHHYTFQDLLCTHSDILNIIKTSVHSKSVNLTRQIIVGTVPDRGGRTSDRRTTMPSFHKRVEHQQQHGRNWKKSKK